MMAIASLMLSWPGCKELFKEPLPDCPEGHHASAGQCCARGEDWVPARRRCMCVEFEVCGRPVTPKARALVPVDGGKDASRVASHPCVGRWKGRARHSEGGRGPVAVEITAVAAGTVEQPHAKTCGDARERFAEEGPCHMRLVRCTYNREILIASGSPSGDSACDQGRVVLRCEGNRAEYRRVGGGVGSRANLERE